MLRISHTAYVNYQSVALEIPGDVITGVLVVDVVPPKTDWRYKFENAHVPFSTSCASHLDRSSLQYDFSPEKNASSLPLFRAQVFDAVLDRILATYDAVYEQHAVHFDQHSCSQQYRSRLRPLVASGLAQKMNAAKNWKLHVLKRQLVSLSLVEGSLSRLWGK